MAYYNMNKIIRLARIAQNIKQEELCSNLCSVGTLSRFENGRLSLKPRLLAALAKKLGISDSVADIVSDSFDPEWQRLRDLYTSAKFRSNLAEEEQHLLSLKKYASTLLQKQYAASEDARLCFWKHKISVKEEHILIDKAIRMTVPDYDKHLDKPFPFTLDECKYLLCLGNTYNDSKPEENEKALSLYQTILRSIDEGYMCGRDVEDLRFSLLFNICFVHSDMKPYADAIHMDEALLQQALAADRGATAADALSEIQWNKKQIARSSTDSSQKQDLTRLARKTAYVAMTVSHTYLLDCMYEKNSNAWS